MIELTRLNGNPLAVNGDLIQFAESSPDTVLTMVTGEKLIVSEDLTEVVGRMVAYRARILAEASRLGQGEPDTSAALACSSAAAQTAAQAQAQQQIQGQGQGRTHNREAEDEYGAAGIWRRRRTE